MEKKTDRKPGKGKALAKDLLKILLCGLAVGLAVTLLLFVAGLLVGRGQIGMGGGKRRALLMYLPAFVYRGGNADD